MIYERDHAHLNSITARRHFRANAIRLFGIFADPASWSTGETPRITSSHSPDRLVYSFSATERATIEFESWNSELTEINLRLDGFLDDEALARQQEFWRLGIEEISSRLNSELPVIASSPAKINLFFGVGAFLKDGYHTVASLYHSLELREQVAIELSGKFEIDFAAGLARQGSLEVPRDKTNLVFKAAQALQASYPQVTPELISFLIKKAIPVAGGMAGGSADAAAALVAIDKLFALGAESTLSEIAGGLGADIPFALWGGSAVGLGKGERLSRISTEAVFHWVVTPSTAGLSTPDVYRKLDTMRIENGIDPTTIEEPVVPQLLLNAVRAGDHKQLARYMHNDLEIAAIELLPELKTVLLAGEEAGALRSMVSGSGPTVVHLAKDRVDAELIAQRMGRLGYPSIATYSSSSGTRLEN